MPNPKIFIIEPNLDTKKFLENILSKDFTAHFYENALSMIDLLKSTQPDLILMDTQIPFINGFDACKKIKSQESTKNISVILMQAKFSTADVVQAFEHGADDFIGKPFDFRELIARIKARIKKQKDWITEPRIIQSDDLKLVIDSREAYYFGKLLNLTSTEFDILKLLIENNGSIITRDDIIEEIWKRENEKAKKRTIDVHIRALRKKIPSLQRTLVSIYGQGYKFER